MIRGALLSFGALLAVAISGAGAAQAQSFDFSYTSNGVSVMGIFNTTYGGDGRYLITSITNGTRGANAITLLAPGGFGNNDNILYFPLPGFDNHYLDPDGLSYAAGTTNYNLKEFSGTEDYADVSSAGGEQLINNLSVTPEGAPAPIPGGGLLSFLALGLAGVIWRRKAIVGLGFAVLGRTHRPKAPL